MKCVPPPKEDVTEKFFLSFHCYLRPWCCVMRFGVHRATGLSQSMELTEAGHTARDPQNFLSPLDPAS